MDQATTLPLETEAEEQEQASQAEALRALFQSWEADDPEEHRDTLAYLQQTLDEDRLGPRKLFP